MAANASEVVVGSGGKIYIAPVGTPEPNTPTAALNAAYKDLGYISEDGVSASFGVTVEDINAFQSLLPIRKVVTGRTADLGDITALAFAVNREGIRQRHHVALVHVTRHAYAVIGSDSLWRTAFPALERTRVVAVGAIDAE